LYSEIDRMIENRTSNYYVKFYQLDPDSVRQDNRDLWKQIVTVEDYSDYEKEYNSLPLIEESNLSSELKSIRNRIAYNQLLNYAASTVTHYSHWSGGHEGIITDYYNNVFLASVSNPSGFEYQKVDLPR